VLGIAAMYILIHVIVSPLLQTIDASDFQSARAPVIEESFKYFVLWKFFQLDTKKENLVKIGLAMGLAETMINFFVVFQGMITDLRISFPDLGNTEMCVIIFLALTIKFTFTGLVQILIMWVGIKMSFGKISLALFISISIHWIMNAFILNSIE
jgi:hypothetical protein